MPDWHPLFFRMSPFQHPIMLLPTGPLMTPTWHRILTWVFPFTRPHTHTTFKVMDMALPTSTSNRVIRPQHKCWYHQDIQVHLWIGMLSQTPWTRVVSSASNARRSSGVMKIVGVPFNEYSQNCMRPNTLLIDMHLHGVFTSNSVYMLMTCHVSIIFLMPIYCSKWYCNYKFLTISSNFCIPTTAGFDACFTLLRWVFLGGSRCVLFCFIFDVMNAFNFYPNYLL